MKTILTLLGGGLIGLSNSILLLKCGVKPTSVLWWIVLIGGITGIQCLIYGALI